MRRIATSVNGNREQRRQLTRWFDPTAHTNVRTLCTNRQRLKSQVQRAELLAKKQQPEQHVDGDNAAADPSQQRFEDQLELHKRNAHVAELEVGRL